MLSLVFALVQANPTVLLGAMALLMAINMGILLSVVREPRGVKGKFQTDLPRLPRVTPSSFTRRERC